MKYTFSILMLAATLCHGQGTFTVTFDQPPPLLPGGYLFVANYFEADMWFRHDPTNVQFQLMRGFPDYTGVPDNGTTYLVAAGGIPMLFSLTDGAAFDLESVDISKTDASVPDPSIGSFIGYLSDGSTVSTNFSVSGVAFQTFQFGPEFSGLIRLEIPSVLPLTAWALDNLVFSAIPEPSSVVFLGIGVLMLAAHSIRKRCSRQ